MTPQQIQSLISQSFSLQPLSRSEKSALAEQIAIAAPDANDLAVLRSALFRQAKTAINTNNTEDILLWLEDMMRLLERFNETPAADTTEAWFSPQADCPGRIRFRRLKDSICCQTMCDGS